MTRDQFTTPEVAILAGLTFSTVDAWDRLGFFHPSIATAHGTGTRRLYSFVDLVSLRVASLLRETGVKLELLRKLVAYIQHNPDIVSRSHRIFLVMDGQEVYVSHGSCALDFLRNSGSGSCFTVVDVSRIVAGLQDVMEEVRRVD